MSAISVPWSASGSLGSKLAASVPPLKDGSSLLLYLTKPKLLTASICPRIPSTYVVKMADQGNTTGDSRNVANIGKKRVTPTGNPTATQTFNPTATSTASVANPQDPDQGWYNRVYASNSAPAAGSEESWMNALVKQRTATSDSAPKPAYPDLCTRASDTPEERLGNAKLKAEKLRRDMM